MSALSLTAAKVHLNIPLNNATLDAEVQTFIDQAESLVGSRCGPLEPTVVTARVRPTSGVLWLPVTPVISVLTVLAASSFASDVDVALVDVDDDTGALSWSGWSPTSVYEVTWVAGYSEVPADLLGAVKEQLRHLWATQRGAAVRAGSPGDTPAPGYLVPNRVAELMEPYQQIAIG